METYLVLNGNELEASVDESERMILDVAAGQCDREALLDWIRQRMRER